LPIELVTHPNFSKALLTDALFHELFHKTDQAWLDHVETKLKSTLKTSSVESPDSWDDGTLSVDSFVLSQSVGSTAVCLVFKNNILSVANCGDSRCIVGRKGKVDQITLDHRPQMKAERDRFVKLFFGGRFCIHL
jgi:serine/threonine protein phosphatase PrpC